jgi:hypothetical protein
VHIVTDSNANKCTDRRPYELTNHLTDYEPHHISNHLTNRLSNHGANLITDNIESDASTHGRSNVVSNTNLPIPRTRPGHLPQPRCWSSILRRLFG